MINKKRKPTTKVKVTTTEETHPEVTQPEVTIPEPLQEEQVTQPAEEVTPTPAPEPVQEEHVTPPVEEITPTPTPTPETKVEPPPTLEPPPKIKPLTMICLKAEINELRALIQALTTQMADVKSLLALKRKPTANGKVQIRDKQTGKIFKSKNSVYQTMLKAGELKELVDKGIFGPIPEKNTFGVYALFRAYPDRFEEVHEQAPEKTE